MKTINDIVREIATEMLNTSMQEITAERIHGWATRLGATCKESLQVGNAAKMRVELYRLASWIRGLTSSAMARERGIAASEVRGIAVKLEVLADSMEVKYGAKAREALLKILGIADHLQTRYALPKLIAKEILELKQIAEAALSAPVRNCDKYSHDEALRIWSSLPESKENGCFDEWLYAEAKGGVK